MSTQRLHRKRDRYPRFRSPLLMAARLLSQSPMLRLPRRYRRPKQPPRLQRPLLVATALFLYRKLTLMVSYHLVPIDLLNNIAIIRNRVTHRIFIKRRERLGRKAFIREFLLPVTHPGTIRDRNLTPNYYRRSLCLIWCPFLAGFFFEKLPGTVVEGIVFAG